ncbi:MAG: TIGR04141 family sporadically distributed protein [Planctomycetota bacterium]
MSSKKRARHLNIYLIKAGLTKPAEVFKDVTKLTKHSIKIGGKKLGDLYVRPSTVRTPSWLSLFAEAVQPSSLGLKTASAAAVLLLKRKSRLLALSFGHGRHLLNSAAFEEDFGLRTTLKAVDPDRIRSIDRKRFDAISRLAREQATCDAPILDFGIDIDQDIVRSMTGPPSDERLGSRITGRESLSVSVPVDLKGLEAQLDRYLTASRSTRNRDHLSFIDNLAEITDRPTRDALDAELLASIAANDLGRIWLAVPDLVDWSDVEGFSYSQAQGAVVHPDVHFESYLEQLRKPDVLSVARMKHQRIYCVSASQNSVINEWPLYRCVYAELESSKGTHFLDNGKWYRIDTDLVSRVDREVRRIKSTKLALVHYQDGETEDKYNERLASSKPSQYTLMDRKMVRYGGGRSQIEFCDVYTKSKAMLHVKRYGGSSVLSHLFAQGVASATCFLWDESFRKALQKKLPRSHHLSNPSARPDARMFEVAFVIASQSTNDVVLPFFSRVNLRNAYRELRGYGFDVTCTQIRINEAT